MSLLWSINILEWINMCFLSQWIILWWILLCMSILFLSWYDINQFMSSVHFHHKTFIDLLSLSLSPGTYSNHTQSCSSTILCNPQSNLICTNNSCRCETGSYWNSTNNNDPKGYCGMKIDSHEKIFLDLSLSIHLKFHIHLILNDVIRQHNVFEMFL